MTPKQQRKIVMASLVLAIIFFVVAPAAARAQASDQNVTANLVIQVQELQDELRELRGRMEEQERELDNLKKRQRDQYLDLDQRITDLNGATPGGQVIEQRGLSVAVLRRSAAGSWQLVLDNPFGDRLLPST